MKRMTFIFGVLVTVLLLGACSTSTPKEPPVLTGEWKQVNSNSEETWQTATIEGDTIMIYWVSNNGDTKSLYWVGSYSAPTTTDEPYSWDSVHDHSKTESSLLASQDDTKKITYENGQLSYSVSALGSTTTVRMEKEK